VLRFVGEIRTENNIILENNFNFAGANRNNKIISIK
jgi:hypothetical protein